MGVPFASNVQYIFPNSPGSLFSVSIHKLLSGESERRYNFPRKQESFFFLRRTGWRKKVERQAGRRVWRDPSLVLRGAIHCCRTGGGKRRKANEEERSISCIWLDAAAEIESPARPAGDKYIFSLSLFPSLPPSFSPSVVRSRSAECARGEGETEGRKEVASYSGKISSLLFCDPIPPPGELVWPGFGLFLPFLSSSVRPSVLGCSTERIK